MTICVVCGAKNRSQAKFCRACGSATEGQLCSSCNTLNSQNAAHCLRCGKRLAQVCGKCQGHNALQAKFCRHCGGGLNQCPHCGESNRPAARFCRRCGKDPTSLAPQQMSVVGLLRRQYRIVRQLARGGMGIVYLSHDTHRQDRVVALKQLDLSHAPMDEHPYFIKTFREEADLLCRLDHPNIVKGQEHFVAEGNEYYVMEFVDGETLEAQSSGKKLSEEEVLLAALQLCDALEYLHDQNPPIIYRDLKPANIMVVRQSRLLKLIDFGIVRRYKPGKSGDTMRLGTPGYAAPEASSGQTGPASDVYSLGATLHVLLTGFDCEQNPYMFPLARQLNGAVSKRMEEALARATQTKEADRFSVIDEMRNALLRCKGAKKISENLPSLAVAMSLASTPNLTPRLTPSNGGVVAPHAHPVTPKAAATVAPVVPPIVTPPPKIAPPIAPPVAPNMTLHPPVLSLKLSPQSSQSGEVTLKSDNGVAVQVNALPVVAWGEGSLALALLQGASSEHKVEVTVQMGDVSLRSQKRSVPNLVGRAWEWAEGHGATRQPWQGAAFVRTLLLGVPSLVVGALAHALFFLACRHADHWVPGSLLLRAHIDFSSGGNPQFTPVQLPVEVEVVPSAGRVWMGWAAAWVAVTLEVGVLLWLLLPLLNLF